MIEAILVVCDLILPSSMTAYLILHPVTIIIKELIFCGFVKISLLANFIYHYSIMLVLLKKVEFKSLM